MAKSPNPSSSTFNSEVLKNSGEQWSSSHQQQHKFMVRGRSLSKNSASAMPSLDDDAEYISKAAAFSSPEPESHASSRSSSCASSRCTSRSRSTAASRANSASSRTHVKLPNVHEKHNSRALSVDSRVGTVSNHRWSSIASLPSAAPEKPVSKWALLKNSLNLPALVGRRASK